VALTNVGRQDARVGRARARAARAQTHTVRIEEAQTRVMPQSEPGKEGAGKQKAETQNHADEHACADARVHCGKEDDAGDGDERGECERVLEAAKQGAQVVELEGGCHVDDDVDNGDAGGCCADLLSARKIKGVL
jgi:hypothetical protein